MFKHKKHIILLLILSSVIYIVFSVCVSSYYIESTYSVLESTAIATNQEMNIVFIADLHDHEFGASNSELIMGVADQLPDIILLGGDMLNDYSENSDIVCELVERLVDIAPTYLARGNHEFAYMESHSELLEEIQAAGAKIVEKTYFDIEVNSIPIRIGGFYDYAFNLANVDDEELAADRLAAKRFLEEFEDTDAFKIMISHRPDSFIFGDAATEWDIDLVLSAHNHGGQVVVPFLGGLYGGDQGWFPEYVHGMYEIGNMHMYVTNGLGSDKKPLPRFNNRPEIAVIKITN